MECLRRRETPRYVKDAMFATLVIGLLTYLFLYTNTIFVHDSIRPFDLAEEAVRSGRWLLGPLTGWRYGLQLPWVIGVAVLACLWATVTLVCSLLEIRSRLGVWLAAAIVVTAPAIADTQVYFFTADCYMLALLLATAAVWLLCRAKRRVLGMLGAIGLLSLSMGIYQSYLCWALTLLLLMLLKGAMHGQRPLKALLIEGLTAVLTLAAAAGLYLLLANVVLTVRGLTWTDYQNLNQMTEPMTLQALLGYIGDAYRDVGWHFFGTPYGYKPSILRIFKALSVLAGVAGTAAALWRGKRGAGFWVFSAIVLALLPASMDAMEILNKSELAHTLMKFAYVAPYLLVVYHLENTLPNLPDGRAVRASARAAALCLVPILLGNWILANSVYTNLKLSYDRSGLLANRVVSAIEQTDDYTAQTPVLLAGFFGDNVADATEGFEMNYAFNVGAKEWAYLTRSNFVDFLQAEMGVRLNLQDASRRKEPEIAQALKEMPYYPNSGYIRWVGDVLVVKLGPREQ